MKSLKELLKNKNLALLALKSLIWLVNKAIKMGFIEEIGCHTGFLEILQHVLPLTSWQCPTEKAQRTLITIEILFNDMLISCHVFIYHSERCLLEIQKPVWGANWRPVKPRGATCSRMSIPIAIIMSSWFVPAAKNEHYW